MFSHLKNMQCTIQHYTAARHCTGDSPQFTGPRLSLSPDTVARLLSPVIPFPDSWPDSHCFLILLSSISGQRGSVSSLV